MASEKSSASMPSRSRKTLQLNPKSSLSDQEFLSSKTPEKSVQLASRTRKRKISHSIKEIRGAAEITRESEGQLPHDRTDGRKSVRRQIDTWPDGSPSSRSKAVIEPKKIPEKFETLDEFFYNLDCAIRFLQLKGVAPNFSNICHRIERLSDRRFSYGRLAQLKFILPEAIELKKILVFDDRTSCMKPELHISINFSMLDNQGNFETGTQSMHLRKLFRTRLSEFLNSHPEIDEVPKDLLPEPFNRSSQDCFSRSSSLSAVKISIEQPAISSTNVAEGVLLNHSEESQDLLVNAAPNSITNVTTGPSKQMKLIGASHFSKSFSRHFFLNREAEKTCQAPNPPAQSSSHSDAKTKTSSSKTEFCDAPLSSSMASSPIKLPTNLSSMASSPIKLPTNLTSDSNCFEKYASPIRLSVLPVPTTPSNVPGRGTMSNDDDPSTKAHDIVASTPAKLVSTPVQLMTNTPAMRPPKRSSMSSPDDDSTGSASKLVTRPPRSRSLIFDTPTKDEIDGTRSESLDNDDNYLDVLPQSFLQSIRPKDRKAAKVEQKTGSRNL